jgi:hypothetical protein
MIQQTWLGQPWEIPPNNKAVRNGVHQPPERCRHLRIDREIDLPVTEIVREAIDESAAKWPHSSPESLLAASAGLGPTDQAILGSQLRDRIFITL